MKQKIKSVIGLLLIFVMVLSIAPVAVFAEEDVLSYLTYEINNGEVTITDCDESISGDVVIPDTIEGYPVTAIGYEGFLGCIYIKNLIIPNTVKTIGNWSISSCISLETIVLPENLTYIDNSAFGYCYSLKSITIPSGVKVIPWSAFVGCFNLKEIIFPDNLELITEAFDFCTSLKSIDIPEGTEEVIEYSFAYCPFMEEVYIYDTDVVLGECSFGYMGVEVLTDYDTYMAALELYINSYNEKEMFNFNIIDQYFSYLDDVKKIDGFVIHGYKGSTAEAYALENGFEFVELCEHNYISGVIKKPTVTEVGIKADVCEYCGDIINAEEIPMLENDGDVSDDTNNTETPDSESQDNSSQSFIEMIIQFFQKIIEFLKNIFAF